MRKFGVGDKVINKESKISGRVLRFYIPTSCEEQTLIKTSDGREYHAPTSSFDTCENEYIGLENESSKGQILMGMDLSDSDDFQVRLTRCNGKWEVNNNG